jgi:hypothetical protein
MNENSSTHNTHKQQIENLAGEDVVNQTQENPCKPKPAEQSPETEVEEQIKRFRQYLRFHWGATEFSKRIEIGIAVIGLLVLIVYTTYTAMMFGVTDKAAEAAKSSADTAAAQLELSERPWVYTDVEIKGPLSFDSKGAHLQIQLTSRNDGITPAVGVSSRAELYSGRPDPHSPNERTRFCGEATSHQGGEGRVILPKSAPEEELWMLEVPTKDIEEDAKFLGYGNDKFGASVIVCTIYKSTFAKDRSPYFTDTTYHLLHILPNKSANPNTIGILKIGENIPRDNLAVVPMFGGVSIR